MMMSLTNARAALWAIDITRSITGLWAAEISFALLRGLINCASEPLGAPRGVHALSGLCSRDFRKQRLRPCAFDAAGRTGDEAVSEHVKRAKFDI